MIVGVNGLLKRIHVFVGAAQLAVVTFYLISEGDQNFSNWARREPSAVEWKSGGVP